MRLSPALPTLPGPLGRIVRNALYLLTGTSGASVLNFMSLVLMARVLGPAQLGSLALIESYARVADQVLRPEGWQACIKYGLGLLQDGRTEDFRRLIKASFLLDLAGTLIATTLAVLASRFAASLFGMDETVSTLLTLYCFTLLFNIASTPTAILRMFDRFPVIAAQQIYVAVIRLGLVAVAFWQGAGLGWFLLISGVASIAGALFLFIVALKELAKRGHGGFWRVPVRGLTGTCPGIAGFIVSSNATVLIRKSIDELDVLIIGALLNPAATGLYHASKRIGDVVRRVSRPLQQTILPELVKLWSAGSTEAFKATIFRLNLAAGSLAVVMLVVIGLNAERILVLALGPAFADAVYVFVLQMAATTLFLFSIASRAAMYALGQQYRLLGIMVVAALLFYGTLFILLPELGIVAAGIAHIVFNLTFLIWVSYALITTLRTPPSTAPSPEHPGEPGRDDPAG